MKIIEVSRNKFIKSVDVIDTMLIEDIKNIFEILNKNSDGENSHNHDSRYYTEQEINEMLKNYSLLKHNHNGSYYQKEEVVKIINDTIKESLGYNEICISSESPKNNEKVWFKVLK